MLALALLAALGLAACASPARGQPVVTVLGSWTGAEQSGFLAMLGGFEKKVRDLRLDYTGTRDADAVLASDLKDGHPPRPRGTGHAGRTAPGRGHRGSCPHRRERWTSRQWPASTGRAG